MDIYKRGGVYWIDFYDQHRNRIQESAHSSLLRDAEDLFTRRKTEVLRGVYKRPVKITFGEFGARYMEHAKTNNITVTMRYAHTNFDSKRAAVDGFGDNLVTVPGKLHKNGAVLSLNRRASYNVSRT